MRGGLKAVVSLSIDWGGDDLTANISRKLRCISPW